MSIIEMDGLTSGNGRGVFDVSLKIEAGEVFGLLGPSGSGKTALIRHLIGFTRPQKGVSMVGGRNGAETPAMIHSTLGYLPQAPALFQEMSGWGFLKFMAKYRGLHSMSRAEELCDLLALNPKRGIRRMSACSRQKLALVCAAMHDPEILILDDPSAGLDSIAQNRLIQMILLEKEAGKTILLASSSFDLIERSCDRAAILNNGRVAAVDTVGAFKAGGRKVYRVTLASEDAISALQRENIDILSTDGCTVTIAVTHDLRSLISILSCYPVNDLKSVSLSLEEIFLTQSGGDSV
ncbi:MAG: ABC transporter ATP-binding protein [Butyricicoccaceae bacterium]